MPALASVVEIAGEIAEVSDADGWGERAWGERVWGGSACGGWGELPCPLVVAVAVAVVAVRAGKRE